MQEKHKNFKKYRNEYFVETGSFEGDGIKSALKAGFKNVISIELSDKYYDICCEKFKDNKNVKIVKGDSYKVLPDVLKEIDGKITFWLDGHHSCGDTALGDYWAPLMQELEVIKKLNNKEHTIMIDDMRCWEEPNETHGFYKKDIYDKLNEINKDYELTIEDGAQKEDVLVAHVKKFNPFAIN